MKRKLYYWLAAISIVFIYFAVRFGWQDTIEFGYDQPKLATIVLDFLKSGSYLTTQSYTQDTIGGAVAWGPSLVYFFAPFLAISKDPIFASLLIAGFNLLSIVFIFVIGWKYYSPKVAYVSAILLATHPWWIIFSRMIYQPTPVPTFVACSVFCLFKTFERPKTLWLVITIFTWGILLQMYLLTFSFILTSFIFLLFVLIKKRVFPIWQFLLGFILNLAIYLPSIIYYSENFEKLKHFSEVKNMYSVTFFDLIKNFFYIVSGGGLEWQLGYAYKIFLTYLKVPDFVFFVIGVYIFLIVLYHFIILSKKNIYNKFLIAMLLAPIWAIPFVGVEKVVPRYFLYILPALTLILAVSIGDLIEKLGKVMYFSAILISVFWLFVMFNYFIFIEKYDYPNGFLSHYSDIPYSYVLKSVDWIKTDSKNSGINNFYVSSDSWAVNYYLDNIEQTNMRYDGSVKYKIVFTNPDLSNSSFAKFGPFTVQKENID